MMLPERVRTHMVVCSCSAVVPLAHHAEGECVADPLGVREARPPHGVSPPERATHHTPQPDCLPRHNERRAPRTASGAASPAAAHRTAPRHCSDSTATPTLTCLSPLLQKLKRFPTGLLCTSAVKIHLITDVSITRHFQGCSMTRYVPASRAPTRSRRRSPDQHRATARPDQFPGGDRGPGTHACPGS